MFGKVFTLLMILSCVACAKPRWASTENQTPPEASQEDDGKGSADEGCRLQFKSGLCLAWAWENAPANSEFASLIFKTYRLIEGQIQPEDLSGTAALVLWMPSMGHGSSPTTVTRIEKGLYRAAKVYFVMPGAWDLHFQNKVENKVNDEVVDSLIME